ncbi:MAG TPA: serine/threonine-protein kinase [Myxococcales bacterium]|nr:serine/threonine-protein kinase [Myxococcales bacterium]
MPASSAAVSCPSCRHTFTDALNFCPKCGADLRGVGGYSDTFEGTLKGKVIAERYEIIDRLGEGGMGSVYKVRHTRMGKVMALKVLRQDLGKQRSAIERFQQEAQLIARLSSQNTISVFDFGEADDGSLYLAMEYLPGQDLAQILRAEGAMPEARAAEIGIQVCRSLAEAHENGIVHRDIKPANVMLLRTRERQDLVKVLDFGIAKLKERERDEAITGLGDFVGTPEYLSPEQARGEALGPPTDIYSLGAMLYELVSGVPVFQGPTPLSVVSQHLTAPPMPPHERNEKIRVSPAFEAVLLKALAKNPAERFASADEMRLALEPLAGLRQVPAFESAPRDTGDLPIASREDWCEFEVRLRRGVWRRNVSALAIFLLLVAGGIWFVRRQLAVPPSPVTEEQEPNDRPKQANLIAPGAPVRGQIGRRFSENESDKDFYVFHVRGRDQVLRAEVTGVPGMALVLDLYRADGKQKTPLARADYAEPGQGVTIPDWPVEGGQYYLEVRAKVPPGQPPPENVSDFYSLTATVTKRLPGEERPPNYTPETASPAGLDDPALGFAGDLGEVDWWAVDALAAGLAEGEPLGAVLSPVPTAELRLVVDRTAKAKGEAPPNVATWIPEHPGELKRFVAVRVAKGLDVNDPYVLAFFTPRIGRPVLRAIHRLHALGRRQEAEALVAAVLELAPNAAWAAQARAALAKPD